MDFDPSTATSEELVDMILESHMILSGQIASAFNISQVGQARIIRKLASTNIGPAQYLRARLIGILEGDDKPDLRIIPGGKPDDDAPERA